MHRSRTCPQHQSAYRLFAPERHRNHQDATRRVTGRPPGDEPPRTATRPGRHPPDSAPAPRQDQPTRHEARKPPARRPQAFSGLARRPPLASGSCAIHNMSHLASEVRVAHVAHSLRLEDCVGKAVHVSRRRLAESTDIPRRQAKAQLDAQLIEEPSNVRVQLVAIAHEGQRGSAGPGLACHRVALSSSVVVVQVCPAAVRAPYVPVTQGSSGQHLRPCGEGVYAISVCPLRLRPSQHRHWHQAHRLDAIKAFNLGRRDPTSPVQGKTEPQRSARHLRV